MITIREAEKRGHFDHGWLNTYHTFSFADYHDPEHMGFRALRVINEDHVAAGKGFPTHAHRDMEIVTVVLEGALEHKDSTGGGSVLRPGEVQRMTAGRGIRHSEFNPSPTEPLHLFQIWILPAERGLEPGYEQKDFSDRLRTGELTLAAAPGARDGAMNIHQDAGVYVAWLKEGKSVAHDLAPGRHAWLQVGRQPVTLNGMELSPGDGVAVSEERRLEVAGAGEIILFDLN